jgi:hypothetical protein
MTMPMAVCSLGDLLVGMIVMTVVMHMRVIVLHRIMRVFVRMRLGEVKHNANEHQRRARDHYPTY